MIPKLFLCPSNHVLGVVERSESGIRRLHLFREAVRKGEVGKDFAVIVGLTYEITCSICGCRRDWVPGEEAIQELLEARGISHTIPQVSS